MILYKTVEKSAHWEQVIEKSRFIAYVSPASTKEEAEAFIGNIKTKHKDATHNVPAMVIGDKFQIQWGSDDGEPQGTSGAPIVQMLVKEQITNLVVVVTRYFGGTKLGTGGLVRAYTGMAKGAVEAAGICEVRPMYSCNAEIEYTALGRLQNLAPKEGFNIEDIQYSDKVRIRVTVEPEKKEMLLGILSNTTNGSVILLDETVENVKKRI